MSRIALVTDSSCGIPAEMVRSLGIKVVRLDVIVNGEVRSELSTEDLIGALKTGHQVTTSRPTPEDFLTVFRELQESGYEAVVAVTLSSALSGTYESAVLAGHSLDIPIRVVDSRSVGLGLGFAVMDAARNANRLELDDLADLVRDQSARSAVYFYLESLDYLRRGGRIGMASALIGTALSVKPILQLEQGVVTPCTKVRTQSKALARMVELALETSPNEGPPRFGVQHLDAPAQAARCVEQLRAVHPQAEIVMSEVTPVVGAHAGPGLVAVIASCPPSSTTTE